MASKQRMRLTNPVIARLRPREREYTVWDTRVAGLGVRVRPSGGACFVFLRKVAGRSTRLSLGPVTANAIDEVRRRCHSLMASADPEVVDETACRVPLFRDFVSGTWKDAHFPRYKPSTRKSAHHSLVSQLLPAFGSTPLRHIDRKQVLRWFDTYSQSAPGGANFAFGVLRQILNFAVACGHITASPVQGIRTNRRATLARFLSRDELGRLHQALEEHSRKGAGPRQQADIIRLLLFTGCRKSEVLKLRWSEVTQDTLVLGDSKTGPRTVPLNAPARRILGRQPRGHSEFVFPSPQNAERPRARDLPLWYSLRRDAGLEDVRLHDLRHTVASHAVMNGVPVPVVSRPCKRANDIAVCTSLGQGYRGGRGENWRRVGPNPGAQVAQVEAVRRASGRSVPQLRFEGAGVRREPADHRPAPRSPQGRNDRALCASHARLHQGSRGADRRQHRGGYLVTLQFRWHKSTACAEAPVCQTPESTTFGTVLQ